MLRSWGSGVWKNEQSNNAETPRSKVSWLTAVLLIAAGSQISSVTLNRLCFLSLYTPRVKWGILIHHFNFRSTIWRSLILFQLVDITFLSSSFRLLLPFLLSYTYFFRNLEYWIYLPEAFRSSFRLISVEFMSCTSTGNRSLRISCNFCLLKLFWPFGICPIQIMVSV